MWTNKQPEWTHLFELLFLPWILRRFLKKPRDRRVLEWWIQIYPWTSSIWPRFLSNSWATLPTNTTNDDHCRHYSKLCTCTVKTNRQQWLHQSTESTERHTWMYVCMCYKIVEEYSSDALLKITAKPNTDNKQTALCFAFI